jgi:hypothetical protein
VVLQRAHSSTRSAPHEQSPAPARRHLLVLWGHGRGVATRLSLPPETIKAGETASDGYLDVPGLARALDTSLDGQPLDILGFDSCFMASIEAIHELRRAATWMLAAQGSIDLHGWDYSAVLAALARSGDRLDARAFARLVVRPVSALGTPTDLGLLDLTKSAALIASLRTLTAALTAIVTADPTERRALRIVLERVRFRRVRQFLDLEDLLLAIGAEFGRVRATAHAALVRLREVVTLHRADGDADGLTSGASIYYPHVLAPSGTANTAPHAGWFDAAIDDRDYASLEMVRHTSWADLLAALR